MFCDPAVWFSNKRILSKRLEICTHQQPGKALSGDEVLKNNTDGGTHEMPSACDKHFLEKTHSSQSQGGQ